MRSPAYSLKFSAVVLATVIIVFSHTAAAQDGTPAGNTSVRPAELNMLVLGDSILWGQGLKREHKAWYLVKQWLEESARLRVNERIEAHAGAVIGTAGTAPPKALTLYGEISSAWPTLHDQVDDALRGLDDPSQVDLILVDGCINDVNARRFMNAANTPEGIEALAREKCSAPVESLLSRIASSFPNAHIIVTGYYPVVSDKTPHDLFMRALARIFYAPTEPGQRRMNDKKLLERLALVSAAWYEASNGALKEAVEKVSAGLKSKGSRQRVLFAQIPFRPEHSFSTRETNLWGFNASTLRKLLALLTWGRVSLHANDEVRSQRSSVCEDFFKRVKGETEDQKRARKDRLIGCKVAAIAHPNRKGALLYADAIKERIQSLISDPGWVRINAVAPPAVR